MLASFDEVGGLSIFALVLNSDLILDVFWEQTHLVPLGFQEFRQDYLRLVLWNLGVSPKPSGLLESPPGLTNEEDVQEVDHDVDYESDLLGGVDLGAQLLEELGAGSHHEQEEVAE